MLPVVPIPGTIFVYNEDKGKVVSVQAVEVLIVARG
jgi:hypothetical protein